MVGHLTDLLLKTTLVDNPLTVLLDLLSAPSAHRLPLSFAEPGGASAFPHVPIFDSATGLAWPYNNFQTVVSPVMLFGVASIASVSCC